MSQSKRTEEGGITVQSVAPNVVCISAFSERAAATDASDGRTSFEVTQELKDSILATGIVEPPIVRPAKNSGYEYETVVGARRVRAVQYLIDDGELPSDYVIDVLVMNWGDFDSLRASITENIDAFRSEVSPSLRCATTVQLWEMNKSTARTQGREEPRYEQFVSETLGVARSTASLWFERAREPWPDASTPITVQPIFERDQKKSSKKVSKKGREPRVSTLDREDAAEKLTQTADTQAADVSTPEKADALFVLPPRYDFISDSKLRILRAMIQSYTDDPKEQKVWGRRVLDKMESYNGTKSSTESSHIQFDFADKDAREASRVMKSQEMTPTEALDWAWERKIEDVAEEQYGSTRVRFSLRGEHNIRLQFLAAIMRTTKEEVARLALQQYLLENRELNGTDLSITEMDKLLKEYRKNPAKLAELYENGEL